ncbi:MAG: helix-turn-helix domain-containing protein [Eubacteriales bacterium]|nr:helix-turn-helix domain-containing protein [Eubacteriales bacterium]
MEDTLLTVKEVSRVLKTNINYVYKLIRTGLLPVLKLGSYKIRRSSLDEFLKKYEGYDLSDPEVICRVNFDDVNVDATD